MHRDQLYNLLEEEYLKYNNIEFIVDDPISIPHSYTKLQDIEISGFFAATLAWGQRKTILRKCQELMGLMDNSPYDFILNHGDSDLKVLLNFKHRTFNSTDLLYFVHFLKNYYQLNDSLEDAFCSAPDLVINIESGLNQFYMLFISDEYFPARTKKHIASPLKKSACKRLNMYLRWMVRKDDRGVDFGLWQKIKPHHLVCPCDVHVEKVARKLKLISRKQIDWRLAVELTENLKKFDSDDPVKYDFALFGMGLNKEY